MSKPKISIVAAMDSKRGIGKDNKIPWRIKDDFIRLRNLTKDHIVILGRKTYESMAGYYDRSGKQMPGKEYIVITHLPDYKPVRQNASAAHSVDEAFTQVQNLNEREVFILGGSQIFEQTIDLANKLYLTLVDGDFNCDSFFPEYEVKFQRTYGKDSRQTDGLKYAFLELEK